MLEGVDGERYQLSTYAGSVVLVDFWATWCAPCRIEIPGFVELFDRYEDRGLMIIGVSIDDPPEAIRRFMAEFSMDYPVVIGDGRDDLKEAYGPLVGFPTTVIVDREGNVCHRHTGFAPVEQFEAEIKALL